MLFPAAVPVHHVIDGVYISSARATLYADYLRRAGITRVLKLYEGIPTFPASFTVFENTINDRELVPPDKFRRGVDFIEEQVKANRSVLVMCGAGISRSSIFVLAHLLEKGYALPDAYFLLREHHHMAQPHYELWQSLITYYGLPYGVQDILDWTLNTLM
jgi:hypothetical protein